MSDREFLLVPSVGACPEADGRIRLDVKFVEGVRLMQSLWGGPVRVLAEPCAAGALPFSKVYTREELPFALDVAPAKEMPGRLAPAAVIQTSADNHLRTGIAWAAKRQGIPCVSTIEYTLSTRLKIASLQRESLLKRIKTLLWTLKTEPGRKRMIRASAGLQCNGVPATASYGAMTTPLLTYFDTRLAAADMGTPESQALRDARLTSGEPLQIAFSGRFERMKGADHLIPAFAHYRGHGGTGILHLFGTGSLEEEMRQMARDRGVKHQVIFHGSVDFEADLVPFIRDRIDVFLCPHRQSDPSCTYIETLGCGVPIVGYDNKAFSGILKLARAGWPVPIDRWEALGDALRQVDGNRPQILRRSDAALAFAKDHSFEETMARRMAHIRQVADAPR